MFEFIDFIIVLLASMLGNKRDLRKEYQKAEKISIDEQNIILENLKMHLGDEASNSYFKYNHLLVFKKKKGLKIMFLNNDYKEIDSIMTNIEFKSNWKSGYIDLL